MNKLNTKMKKTLLQLTVACALALAMTPGAQAQVLANDAFLTSFGNYSPGAVATLGPPPTGQNPTVTGFNGPWNVNFQNGGTSTITATPLTYTAPTGYFETTGAGTLVNAVTGGGIGTNVQRGLDPSVTTALAATSGTFYMSFELQIQSTTGLYQGVEMQAGGVRMFQLGESTSNDFSNTTNFGVTLLHDGGNPNPAFQGSLGTLDTNAHLFVFEFNLASGNNDTLTAFEDPTNLTGATPTGGIQTTITGFALPANVNGFGLSTFFNPGTSLSEVRMGNTLADITGAVPEVPTSSLTLLGLGVLAVVMVRRKMLA